MSIIKNEFILSHKNLLLDYNNLFVKREEYNELEKFITKMNSDVIIYGPTGTGKTTTILHFFENNNKVDFIYVDCKQNIKTEKQFFNIVNQIIKLKFFFNSLSRGVDFFIEFLSQRDKPLYIVFDDIDAIISNRNNIGIRIISMLQDLFLKEINTNKKINNMNLRFVLITNVPEFSKRIDNKLITRFTRKVEIVFNKYSVEQIYKILYLRAKYGLKEGTWNRRIIYYIAEQNDIYFDNNVRDAINILNQASLLSEEKLTEKEVDESINYVKSDRLKSELYSFGKNTLIFLFSIALKINNKLKIYNYDLIKNINEQYDIYIKKSTNIPISQSEIIIKFNEICNILGIPIKDRRSINNYLKDLLSSNIIIHIETKNRERIFKLMYSPKLIMEYVSQMIPSLEPLYLKTMSVKTFEVKEYDDYQDEKDEEEETLSDEEIQRNLQELL